MSKKNQPYLKLYVQDFMTDEKLRGCSASANGVYIWIMFLMTKYEVKGVISLKQKFKQTNKQMVKQMVKQSVSKNSLLLTFCLNFAKQLSDHLPFKEPEICMSLLELIEEDVLQMEGDYLIQKRIKKDGELSVSRSLSGKKGAKARIQNLKKNNEVFNEKNDEVLPDVLLKQNSSKNMTIINNKEYTGNNTLHDKIIYNGNEENLLKNSPNSVNRFYKYSFEELLELGKSVHNGIKKEEFEQWKRFVEMCDSNEHQFHTDIFKGKFIFPKDWVEVVKKGFTENVWQSVIRKILSVGYTEKHNLFWRIPDALNWVVKEQKSPKKESTDNLIIKSGDSDDYSKSSF